MNRVFEFTRKALKGENFLESLSTSLNLICDVNHKLSFGEKRWDGIYIFIDKKCKKKIYIKWDFDNETKKDIPVLKCCGKKMNIYPTPNGIRHYFCSSCRYKMKLYKK